MTGPGGSTPVKPFLKYWNLIIVCRFPYAMEPRYTRGQCFYTYLLNVYFMLCSYFVVSNLRDMSYRSLFIDLMVQFTSKKKQNIEIKM